MKERITNSCLFKCFFVLLLAFTTKMPTNLYGSTIVINGQSYEDLGLPSGTLWSLRNVGANTSTEVGYFYAWGETLTTLDGKLYFRKDNYKWASVPGEGYWGPEYLTKYYSGDGKKTLDSNNDPAALGQYGSGGVMPTDIQMKELLTECTWTPTSGGVNVVGPNGSSIFLPAGGYKYDNNTYESGESLCYWSKDVHYYNSTYNWERACNFWVYSDASSIQRAQNICDYSDGLGGSNRFYGMLIRPVATTYASRVKVTSIIISGPSSIGADATEKLTASCSPSNASSKKVWWTTSDYTIADVDAEGNVTGKKVGTVTITAIAKDGGGAKKTKTISIVAPIEVTSIAISGSTSIAVGSSTTLTATCSPSNATNKSITWSSSNTKVATVTSQGVVTGNAVGTTTIKAQASNGVYKEVTMEVTAGTDFVDLGLPSGTLWGIRNIGAANSTACGNYYAWGETITTSSGKSSFRKDNYKWASVPGEGYWGPEYLTKYYSSDGKKTLDASDQPTSQYNSNSIMPSDIQMKELLTECTWTPTSGGVTIVGPNGSSIFLPAGGYKYDTQTYDSGTSLCYWSKDVNYYNSTYYWESACGLFTEMNASSIQGLQNSCRYNCGIGCLNRFYGQLIRPVSTYYASRVKITQITISGPSYVRVGETEQLTVTCSPYNVSSKKVWWTTSDNTIADVDADGKVTGKKIGSVTITAIAKDGSGVYATCDITVTEDYSDPTSGKCGENLFWSLSEDGVLTITGSGDMDDYSGTSCPGHPWGDVVSVVLPNGLTSIGDGAFSGCSLTEVTIPASVEYIGSDAFSGCNISELTIPASVKYIDSGAFSGCNISELTIPASVNSIGTYAFSGCSQLLDVYVTTSEPIENDNIFYDCDLGSATLHVPDGSIMAYRMADGWNEFGNIIEDGTGVIARGYCGANGGNNLQWYLTESEDLVITGSGEMCGFDTDDHWYGYSYEIVSVTLPEGLTSIGKNAFYNCSLLSSITIPETVTSIGQYAFSGSGISELTIPASVTRLEYNALYINNGSEIAIHITDLAAWCRINTGENVGCPTSDQQYRLYLNDTEITDLVIPGSVTGISAYAFANCWSIGTLTIPAGVTSIEGGAFEGCGNLSVVTVMNTVPIANLSIFDSNISNATLYVPKGSLSAYQNAEGWKEFGEILPIEDPNDPTTFDYAIYCPDQKVFDEKQFTMTVCLKNINAITMIQTELVLPPGVTVATDSEGKLMIAVSGERTTSAIHDITAQVLKDGVVSILCSSKSNKTFSGNDGEVLSITLNVDTSVTPGIHSIKLKNQILGEPNEATHYVNLIESKLIVLDSSRMDQDFDGDVDMADVAILIEYIKTHLDLSVGK